MRAQAQPQHADDSSQDQQQVVLWIVQVHFQHGTHQYPIAIPLFQLGFSRDTGSEKEVKRKIEEAQ